MGDELPTAISLIVIGAAFLWLGSVFLSTPASGPTESFMVSAGYGFVFVGVIGIIGGILSIVRNMNHRR